MYLLLITPLLQLWMRRGEFYHIFNIAMEKGSSDLFLINRLKGGDKQAFLSLYDRYAGALYGVIFRMCRERELTEDLLQECFVKIWQNISSYDAEKGRFYTWSYRIARNTVLNHMRKPSLLIQNEDLSVYDNKGSAPRADDDYEQLKGLIDRLDEHHRRALELVYFKGYTHREAHKLMQVPLGTFKSYVRQALNRLRSLRGELHMIWFCLEVWIHG